MHTANGPALSMAETTTHAATAWDFERFQISGAARRGEHQAPIRRSRNRTPSVNRGSATCHETSPFSENGRTSDDDAASAAIGHTAQKPERRTATHGTHTQELGPRASNRTPPTTPGRFRRNPLLPFGKEGSTSVGIYTTRIEYIPTPGAAGTEAPEWRQSRPRAAGTAEPREAPGGRQSRRKAARPAEPVPAPGRRQGHELVARTESAAEASASAAIPAALRRRSLRGRLGRTERGLGPLEPRTGRSLSHGPQLRQSRAGCPARARG